MPATTMTTGMLCDMRSGLGRWLMSLGRLSPSPPAFSTRLKASCPGIAMAGERRSLFQRR